MSEEQREYFRTDMRCRVLLRHPRLGDYLLILKNLSDGGVFIETDCADEFTLGDVVEVQVQGLIDTAPLLSMTVIRKSQDGLGLCF
jgi:hypothetical protein